MTPSKMPKRDSLDLNEALDTALKTAKCAGDLLMRRSEEWKKNRGTVKQKTSHVDVVTEVDTEVQTVMVKMLHEAFPEHRILGEEGGTDDIGDPGCPYQWILDPLDGTMCFVHGKENFGTLLALRKGDKVVLGIIHLPCRGWTFAGTRGGGAFLNGSHITLRQTKDMQDAVLCCNLRHRASKDAHGNLSVVLPDCASIENYGSAAEEIGRILLGQNDGAFFKGIPIWDVAAGMLLVEEAGGKAEGRWVNKEKTRMTCLMCTEPIFEDLKKFVYEEM